MKEDMEGIVRNNNKILDHFFNPRNLGRSDSYSAMGTAGDFKKSGIVINFFLVIEDELVKDIKFLTQGCVTSVASASILTELVKGKTIYECLNITEEDVSNGLGGVPLEKMHCCGLVVEALHDAISKYRSQAEEAYNLVKNKKR